MDNEELAAAKQEFERSWHAYEFLRDNLIEESTTSRLLHTPGIKTERYIRDKITEETIEVRDSMINAEVKERTIEEGSQVWYWTTLACIRNGTRYNELKPHEIIMNGYQKGMPDGTGTPVAFFAFGSKESVIKSARRTLDYLGMVLRRADVRPVEIALYDINQMQRKHYLRNLFETPESPSL